MGITIVRHWWINRKTGDFPPIDGNLEDSMTVLTKTTAKQEFLNWTSEKCKNTLWMNSRHFYKEVGWWSYYELPTSIHKSILVNLNPPSVDAWEVRITSWKRCKNLPSPTGFQVFNHPFSGCRISHWLSPKFLAASQARNTQEIHRESPRGNVWQRQIQIGHRHELSGFLWFFLTFFWLSLHLCLWAFYETLWHPAISFQRNVIAKLPQHTMKTIH